MTEGIYVPHSRHCCYFCAHYRPHYIFGHYGTPFPLRYGHCAILPFTVCEEDALCDFFTSA